MTDTQRRVDRRADSLKWIDTAGVLRTRHTACQRDVDAHADRVISVAAEMHEGFREAYVTDANFRQEMSGCAERRGKVAKEVRRVHGLLTQRAQPASKWLDDARQSLTDLDSRIMQEKQHHAHQLQLLAAEAASLDVSLQADTEAILGVRGGVSTRRSQSPASLPSPRSRRSSSVEVERQKDGAPIEVMKYQRFVEQYGKAGGWGEEDHGVFLRVVGEVRKVELATQRLCVLLGREEGEVVEHCRWHARHEELLQEKRMAIAEWQRMRAVDTLNAEAVSQRREEREASLAAQRKQRQQRAHSARREHTSHAILAWKESKAQRSNAAAQQDRTAAQLRQQRNNEERAKRDAVKAQVAEYRLKV